MLKFPNCIINVLSVVLQLLRKVKKYILDNIIAIIHTLKKEMLMGKHSLGAEEVPE